MPRLRLGRGEVWYIARLVLTAGVVAILLFLLWNWRLERWYALTFRAIAIPVYKATGLGSQHLVEGVQLAFPRFVNILPFVALMAAIPELRWKRRLFGVLVGLTVLFVWHMVLTAAATVIHSQWGLNRTAYMYYSPMFLLSDALPFLLWFVIARQQLTSRFFPGIADAHATTQDAQ